MSGRPSLFRPESMAPSTHVGLGRVVLLQPLSMRLLTLLVMAFSAGLLLFLCSASYTASVPAAGVLMPEHGLVKVHAPRGGLVVERKVREGQHVKAGDVLFILSAEVVYLPSGGSGREAGFNAAVLKSLQEREDIAAQDRQTADAMASSARADERGNVASLQAEIAQLDLEIAAQAERVESKAQQYEYNVQAKEKGFISPLGLRQKQDELLDQKGRLYALQRGRQTTLRQLAAARAGVDAMQRKDALARSEYRRQLLAIDQERAAQELSGQIVVTAPAAGMISAVQAEVGQRVDGQPLLTILPEHSQLEAQLFLTSQAVGQIKVGDPVTLRFSAFPHLQFGAMTGSVREISHAPLSPADLVQQAAGARLDAPAAAHYRIRVALPAQALARGGRHYPLRSGLELNALVAGEQHSLLGWVLAPLRQLKEKA